MNFRLKIFRNGLFLWALLAASGIPSTAAAGRTDQTALFLQGVEQYRHQEYSGAVKAFSQLVAGGIVNGKLYYNLANAYLKTGELGPAILWYERSLRLMPGDPDVTFNLTYARSLIKDRSEVQDSSVWRVLFFWNHLLNDAQVQYGALTLNVLMWIAMVVSLVRPLPRLRWVALSLCVLMTVFSLTVLYRYVRSRGPGQGIILPPKVAVRSGTNPTATELFVLHAGTKVRIEKATDGYCRIYFAPGKIGWLETENLGII